jgi:hypothetical protein
VPGPRRLSSGPRPRARSWCPIWSSPELDRFEPEEIVNGMRGGPRRPYGGVACAQDNVHTARRQLGREYGSRSSRASGQRGSMLRCWPLTIPDCIRQRVCKLCATLETREGLLMGVDRRPDQRRWLQVPLANPGQTPPARLAVSCSPSCPGLLIMRTLRLCGVPHRMRNGRGLAH